MFLGRTEKRCSKNLASLDPGPGVTTSATDYREYVRALPHAKREVKCTRNNYITRACKNIEMCSLCGVKENHIYHVTVGAMTLLILSRWDVAWDRTFYPCI